MTYKINITLQREESNDLEIAKQNFGDKLSDNDLLHLQLKKELQQAYDENIISGLFNIDKILPH